jgi:hypothetical protein
MASVEAYDKEDCTYICTKDSVPERLQKPGTGLGIERSIIQQNLKVDPTYSGMANP